MPWRIAASAIAVIFVASCTTVPTQLGRYAVSVAQGLEPRLSASDAVSITIGYLNDQHPDAPPIAPHVGQVWAVDASEARMLDGCIPARPSGSIVWVTKGQGDYLNTTDRPWSHNSSWGLDDPVALSCEGPGPAGTIVIDDATGTILGVYPYVGPDYPHPTPAGT